jgi:putative two-component system response regulator
MNLEMTDLAIAQTRLMAIDDNVENLRLLERVLEWAGFRNVRCFTSGQEGLDAITSFNPDLIILDLNMPKMNGYEFLKRVRQEFSTTCYLPVLVYTADLSMEAKIRALELGASDFLTKPGDAVEIKLRITYFLRAQQLHFDLQHHNQLLELKVRQRTELLDVARMEAVELLAGACEYRDDDTGKHTQRVGELSAAIAQELGLDPDFVESLRLVAPLHDVGKIAIPDYILHKPGSLSTEEYGIMKCHVGIGANLLEQKTSPLLQLAAEIARYHHERWDGKGYQAGLAGEAIPLSARIVTVADTFDAITNDRPYRARRSVSEALQELTNMAGSQFDPSIVAALHRHLSTLTRVAA